MIWERSEPESRSGDRVLYNFETALSDPPTPNHPKNLTESHLRSYLSPGIISQRQLGTKCYIVDYSATRARIDSQVRSGAELQGAYNCLTKSLQQKFLEGYIFA